MLDRDALSAARDELAYHAASAATREELPRPETLLALGRLDHAARALGAPASGTAVGPYSAESLRTLAELVDGTEAQVLEDLQSGRASGWIPAAVLPLVARARAVLSPRVCQELLASAAVAHASPAVWQSIGARPDADGVPSATGTAPVDAPPAPVAPLRAALDADVARVLATAPPPGAFYYVNAQSDVPWEAALAYTAVRLRQGATQPGGGPPAQLLRRALAQIPQAALAGHTWIAVARAVAEIPSAPSRLLAALATARPRHPLPGDLYGALLRHPRFPAATLHALVREAEGRGWGGARHGSVARPGRAAHASGPGRGHAPAGRSATGGSPHERPSPRASGTGPRGPDVRP